MNFTIIDFDEFYGFHQLCLAVRKEVLLLTSAGQFIFILLFRMGQSTEVLAVFFYQYTSRQYYYSTVRRLKRQEVQEMSRLELLVNWL